jgi:hypothetical protein
VRASYGRVEEGITSRCNKINTWYVDLFHRRRLIKTVLTPSFNHIYMSLGFCAEAGQRVDNPILKLLFNIFILFFIYIQRKTRDDEKERSPLVESLPLGYLFLPLQCRRYF